ncbi:MAG: prepilin-type N-terminal cleavage/methylation domain-containing protein, partial [Gammaproteobacteria bacterium]|nr:prepilin-type N-terminal cleavage/methylation domain-containing protein [Gammaproteobacteria bacterium]
MSSQRGFSLVELMVAMFVSLLLLAATIALFINSKRAYQESSRFARVEENARYALFALENDIRLAKFFGEVQASDITKDGSLSAVTSDCTGDAAAYKFSRPLVAATAGAGSAFGCVTTAVVGSDVIAVKSVRPMPHKDTDDDGDIDADDTLAINNQKSYVMANSTTAV